MDILRVDIGEEWRFFEFAEEFFSEIKHALNGRGKYIMDDLKCYAKWDRVDERGETMIISQGDEVYESIDLVAGHYPFVHRIHSDITALVH